jgi:protein involved in polysaccharide export with SLBB domain
MYGDSLIQEEDEVRYFGYEFFNNPDRLAVLENQPVPKEYRLGPGDQIVITIWGDTESRSLHEVDLEGNIYIESVGLVNVTGKNLTESENLIRNRFSKLYSTLLGPEPTAYLDITLAGIKSINVTFVGEVLLPGIHAIHPFSYVTTGLIQVNGLSYHGSLRNIHVIRNDEIIATLDFYEYLLSGKSIGNIRLLDGDVILVPHRKATVQIEGEVGRPAFYEPKAGESIQALLKHAGGLTPKAQETIQVIKILPREKRVSDDFAYEMFYVSYDEAAYESAADIEHLLALPIPIVERQVSVFGQVKSPGIYTYEDSMTVLDLLLISGGINDETFWKSMYGTQAEIIRRDPTREYPTRILINLSDLRNGDESQNIVMENMDLLLVRQNLNFAIPSHVIVAGEVNIPGVYTIQKKEESLAEIIERAGGYSANAFSEGLQMFRDSLQIVLKGDNIPVLHADSIYVPQHPGIVHVVGEIQNPGLVEFIPGNSLQDYIESAGGYKPNANRKYIAVHYANGDVKLKKSRWFSPPVKEGSTIRVYKKPPSEPFNPTQFLQSLSSAVASLATIYFIVTESRRN